MALNSIHYILAKTDVCLCYTYLKKKLGAPTVWFETVLNSILFAARWLTSDNDE